VAGAFTAVSHLIRLGYKQIGTITGSLNTIAGQHRLEGYQKAHNQLGRSLNQQLIAEGDFSEASAYHAMLQLINHQVDAVFVASDAMAQGGLRAIRTKKYQRTRSDRPG
jgi:DNA-binding LacI/PurR family transcriptional regulator